jgi:cytochrome c peroxidase
MIPLPSDAAEYAPLPTYEPMPIPDDNPMSPEKAALGRQLYYDQRLSGDGVRSCYSCHLCEKGLTDGRSKAIGAFDKQLTRSSPTLWNIGYHSEFYWDGRAKSLESQALAAWKGGNMGAEPEKVVARLNSIQGYGDQFQKVFKEDATPENVPKALAAYMRTIIGGNTRWDQWSGGDESALSEEEKRGWQVFQKAKCDNCHSGALFTDLQYHNVGIGMEAPEPDLGRFKTTQVKKDRGAFKTPTLRDISQSAPYFHDGSADTLEEAVDILLKGGKPNPYLDRVNLEKVRLKDTEKSDLIAFLRSLDEPCSFTEPALPPE